MTENSHHYASVTAARVHRQAQDQIVFWGNPLRFSDHVLRLAAAESGMMETRRVASLDELEPRFGGRRFIFFDDEIAEEVLAAPHEWLAEHPDARWVLAYRDNRIARRLLDLRRRDPALVPFCLLPMSLPIDQWTPMFRLVLGGDCFLPVGLLEQEPDNHPATPGPVGENEALLTPREREVLALVAEGKRNKTIAHELGLSEHTIKLHLHHVITKIKVRNRTQAAQWFLTRRYGRAQ